MACYSAQKGKNLCSWHRRNREAKRADLDRDLFLDFKLCSSTRSLSQRYQKFVARLQFVLATSAPFVFGVGAACATLLLLFDVILVGLFVVVVEIGNDLLDVSGRVRVVRLGVHTLRRDSDDVVKASRFLL